MSGQRTFFAQIENNIVTAVHVVTREFLDENPDRYQGEWVETFIDRPDKTYAGIGYVYDPVTKDFSEPIIAD
jgi:hypothetical protein